MGGCSSSPAGAAADDAGAARSRMIDKALKEDEKKMAKEVKLLLLGAGASGKSTVLKQMRFINNRPFSADEVEDYRKIVFSNIVGGMRSIIDTMDDLGVAVSIANRKHILLVDNEIPINTGEAFPTKYLEALKGLWGDEGVAEVYAKAHEYALQENLPYFYAQLDRLFEPGYTPTQADILRVRSKTTGISETRFDMKDLIVRLFDVGGQRSERRKWASCFEGVTSILFLVSLSDYNACIIEDRDSNGMVEALILFESIVNSQWFIKSSIILFLNKVDVLADKLLDPSQLITTHFPDYTGKPDSSQDVIEFFKRKFFALNKHPEKTIYAYPTTATNSENIKVVMSAVLDTIVRQNLRDMAII